MDSSVTAPPFASMSLKLWPPSKSTRLSLVQRITTNLTTPSILSRKYGLLSKEEAEEHAKEIEEEAFTIADKHFEKEPDVDGSSAVRLYASESSKLMVEVLKRGPTVKQDGNVLISEKVTAVDSDFFDISGGRRAFIDAEEAEQLLLPLSKPHNSYTRICFSNRSFGLDAARVAEPILITLRDQLTEVDLSDFVAGRPEAEALEVMGIFSSALKGSKLRLLDLSNNAMGEKGVNAFEGLLRSQHHLEELYLMNDGISEEAARAVREFIPSTEKLKILHFHNNMTGDEGAIAIAEIVKCSPALEDFRCSSTRVDSEGGVALAEALGSCAHIRKLDLRDNMFGVEAGLALCKPISRFADLTEVYLSYLNLEDEGAIAISKALKDSAPSLEVLELAGNDITAEAAPDVAACIQAKQFLTKLCLSENELKDEGAIVISKSLESGLGQLIEIDMSTNGLRIAGAKALAQAIANKTRFKLLNINGNYISEEGIDDLKIMIPHILGPLDENDPEGEDDVDLDDEAEVDDEELESKLKGLQIKHE